MQTIQWLSVDDSWEQATHARAQEMVVLCGLVGADLESTSVDTKDLTAIWGAFWRVTALG